jgi:hypothetical protein
VSVDYEGGRVVAIQFADSSRVARYLEAAKGLRYPRKIVFARTAISANALTSLATLDELQELEIDGETFVRDGELFDALAALPHLRRVSLHGILVGEDVLHKLQTQRPGVEFDLHPPRESNEQIADLAAPVRPNEPPPPAQIQKPLDIN